MRVVIILHVNFGQVFGNHSVGEKKWIGQITRAWVLSTIRWDRTTRYFRLHSRNECYIDAIIRKHRIQHISQMHLGTSEQPIVPRKWESMKFNYF